MSIWGIELLFWSIVIFLVWLSTILFGYVKVAPDAFKNKVVWITGASSGIGEALAKQFYKSGARLILSARREEELKRVVAECEASGKGFPPSILVVDLEELEGLTQKAKTALQINGRIDILINNGGLSSRSSVLDTSFDVDVRLTKVNFLSAILLTKFVVAHMFTRGTGFVVAVNSLQGKLALPDRSSYSASKFALHAFYQSLRMELADEKKMHVMEVFPGYVQTNLSLNALTGSGEKHGKMDATTAQGYTPDYVARKIIEGILMEEKEVVVAKPLHRFVIYAQHFFPSLVERLLVKRAKSARKSEN